MCVFAVMHEPRFVGAGATCAPRLPIRNAFVNKECEWDLFCVRLARCGVFCH